MIESKKVASALLAGALVMGVGAPAFSVNAFADETEITEPTGIDENEGTEVAAATSLKLVTPEGIEAGTSYTAIKVFSADITGAYDDEEAPKASGIQFANGVTGALIAGGATDEEDNEIDLSNPQVAAEFVNANMSHQPGVGLNATDYGVALAKRLMLAGADTKTVVADGEAIELDGEGYYLIVKTDELIGENTAATSPIYAALSEGTTEIKLKVAIPSITKEIQEDSDSEWGDEADHTLNQQVNYRLTGTMPANIDAFETYEYNFIDSWDADKMTLMGDVVVTVDGVDVTDQATIGTDEAGKLTVSFTDLKALTDDEGEKIAITADTEVVVSYSAYQSGTTASPEGIVNEAYIEYSNNPVFEGKGETPKVEVKDYSYALKLHKTDNATGEDLAGVEFSFVNAEGKYLAIDEEGKLVESDNEYSFVTDENGLIVIDGVDADDYTVVETKALAGYDELGADITVAVNAGDKTAVVSAISSDTDLVAAGEDDDVVALINVKNVKEIPLPSTGAMGLGLAFLIAAGFAVRAVIRKRQKDDAEVMFV